MTGAKQSRASIIWLGMAGLAGVSILFAPAIHGGWCADATVGGTSVCGSFQRSLIGIDTTIWLWLASMEVVVVISAAGARRLRKSHR